MQEATARLCDPTERTLTTDAAAKTGRREPRRLARALERPRDPSAAGEADAGGDRPRIRSIANGAMPQEDARWCTETEARGGAETVLVVEDEQLVRDLVKEMLALHGYCVLVADSPHQALEMTLDRDKHIDLLLADVVMPQMSGLELWERAAPHRPDMRVLFMSGYADNVVSRRKGGMGSLPLLEKPFTIQALAQAVRNVLDTSA
jgi:CheY-like chemotaxis protein